MHDLIAVEKIAQREKLKALVLDSVSSPITKRVYNMALNEFMTWFQQAPRPGFTKATVRLAPSSWGDLGIVRGLCSNADHLRRKSHPTVQPSTIPSRRVVPGFRFINERPSASISDGSCSAM